MDGTPVPRRFAFSSEYFQCVSYFLQAKENKQIQAPMEAWTRVIFNFAFKILLQVLNMNFAPKLHEEECMRVLV